MNEEDIFYYFTQAMDLKYEDTVEAIHDLVTFCITTENSNIWNEIYDFVRTKAQQIIDLDYEYDKKDCIEQFKNDDWLKKYIKQIKSGEKMTYSYNKVIEIIRDIEEEIMYDVEAPNHWYMIAYENNLLTISEIDEYHFNGDEWGEMCTKTNVSKIEEFECTLVEYTNFIIRFYNQQRVYREHEYPKDNYILNKIEIMEVKE